MKNFKDYLFESKIDSDIKSHKGDETISEIFNKYKKNRYLFKNDEINIDEFSQHIENLLINLQTENIILIQSNQGIDTFVSGETSIKSIVFFIDNKYQLNNLEHFEELNGLFFKDIERKFQRKIEQSKLYIQTIHSHNSDDVKNIIKNKLKKLKILNNF